MARGVCGAGYAVLNAFRGYGEIQGGDAATRGKHVLVEWGASHTFECKQGGASFDTSVGSEHRAGTTYDVRGRNVMVHGTIGRGITGNLCECRGCEAEHFTPSRESTLFECGRSSTEPDESFIAGVGA